MWSNRSSSATAVLEASDPTGSISSETMSSALSPIAKQVARGSFPGATVTVADSASAGLGSRSFTFTAEGEDPELCIQAANEAANAAAERASQLFEELNEALNADSKQDIQNKIDVLKSLEVSDAIIGLLEMYTVPAHKYEFCTFSVIEATAATEEGRSLSRLLLVGLAGGVVLALAVLFGIDAIRRPIKGPNDVVENLGLRVLSFPFPKAEAGYLWMNIKHVCGLRPRTISVIPLSENGAIGVVDQIERAVRREGFGFVTFKQDAFVMGEVDDKTVCVVECDLIEHGERCVQIASEVDAAIIAASPWEDTLGSAEMVLEGLKFADANLIGVAFSVSDQQ